MDCSMNSCRSSQQSKITENNRPSHVMKSQISDAERMSYPCTFEGCVRTFTDPSSRKKHAAVHTGDKPHRCCHCMMAFSDGAAMHHHVKAYHDVPTKTPAVSDQGSEKEEFWCPYCASSFSSIAAVDSHINESHQKETRNDSQRGKDRVMSLRCTYEGCNRTFAWSHHLQYHIKTHEGNRAFACYLDGCSKTFYTAQQRDTHVKSHTGERNFACSVAGCYKRFTTAQNLGNHTRTHTGEKPYKCDFPDCDKVFAEYSSLKKHSVTHTGEKPYQCPKCERAFTQSSSLRTHIKRRHQKSEHLEAAQAIAGDKSKIRTPRKLRKRGTKPLKGWESTQVEYQEEPAGPATPDVSSSVIVLSQPSETVVLPSFYEEHVTQDNDFGLCAVIPGASVETQTAVGEEVATQKIDLIRNTGLTGQRTDLIMLKPDIIHSNTALRGKLERQRLKFVMENSCTSQRKGGEHQSIVPEKEVIE